VNQKKTTDLVTVLPNNERVSKFFHLHTVPVICTANIPRKHLKHVITLSQKVLQNRHRNQLGKQLAQKHLENGHSNSGHAYSAGQTA